MNPPPACQGAFFCPGDLRIGYAAFQAWAL